MQDEPRDGVGGVNIIGRAMSHTSRVVSFGRHMPLRKVMRRVELHLRRRLRDHVPPRFRPEALLPLAEAPPGPLFPPRRGVDQGPGGLLTFHMLGRTIAMRDGRVDWSQPGPGAEHQLLRMNLHYMEFLESADDDLMARLVVQWIDDNPAGRPGAWRDAWNSYALSLRVVVWMQQLALRADRLEPGVVERMHGSLGAQLRFLAGNLETDLGGNHLIKNIKALLWASAYFAGPQADRWRKLGLDLLAVELPRQVLADGMHYERSPSYHAQVLADLLECRHALGADRLGGALDAALDAAVDSMAEAITDLTHPDDGPALFNDAGLSMAYAPAECLDVYERLRGRSPAPRPVFAFPDAGYFGLRSEQLYLVADCGRIAPDDLPAHGHGDVLSFELSCAGHRFIVDQGVFEYAAGTRRQASRSTASHNTLSLDGVDQADFFGAFRCGRRPNVTVRRFQHAAEGFVLEGSHDGFSHLPGRPIHVRCFEASPRHITITDRIEGTTDRAARLAFLLHPEVEVEIAGHMARLSRDAVEVEMIVDAPIEVEAAVWWPDMGYEEATTRLRVPLAASSAEFVTHLRVLADGRDVSSPRQGDR